MRAPQRGFVQVGFSTAICPYRYSFYRDEPGATNASFRMRFLRPILADPQGTESVC